MKLYRCFVVKKPKLCQQHDRAELLALFKSEEANSNIAAGRMHMTRFMTRIWGGWRRKSASSFVSRLHLYVWFKFVDLKVLS